MLWDITLMETCPRCDRAVDRVHPLPPAVITKELIETYETLDVLTENGVCPDCLDELMAGGPVA